MAKGWKKLCRLRGHESRIERIAWSPDGGRIATASLDGRVILWDPQTKKPTVERVVGPPALSVNWSPHGDALAVSVADRMPIDSTYDHVEAESEMYEGRGGEDELLRTFEASVTPPGGEPDWDRYEGAMNLRVLDATSGLQIAALDSGPSSEVPVDVVWLDDMEHLAAAFPGGVGVWDIKSGHFVGKLQESGGHDFRVLLKLLGGRLLGVGPEIDRAFIWDIGPAALTMQLPVYGGISGSVDPGTGRVAIGTDSGLVQILNPSSPGSREHALEGHAGGVTGASFSADGRLLATIARDGVKLWSTEDWTLLSEVRKKIPGATSGDIAFSPTELTLAVLGADENEVSLWSFDLPALAAKQNRPATVHYANAKVVLVGDTGVGKSGLGLVLAGKTFQPTDSTHQRNIWNLSSDDTTGDQPEHREVFLWDLAGQPGYRLLHQLHLADIAVALIVFDARNELDPLSGVRYWCRALDQAARISDSDTDAIARILVAARMDRGGAKVSDDDLRAAREQFHLSEYVTTSAKEGAGIQTLRQRIEEAIDWSQIPKVSSTGLFESIRRFLVAKRSSSVVLTRESDLRDTFSQTGAAPEKDVLDEFRVCVDRLQSRGLLRRLTFGDLVLLRPEVLDAYAAAVINAAANEKDGLGAIKEADVRSGSFLIPEDDRLKDREAEKLLLIATIEDLLKHEVALREDSGSGSYLVFPTQTKKSAAADKTLKPWCAFNFEGPIAHIWATLVVRLSHSEVFVRDSAGLNFASFRGAGRTVGMKLSSTDEGAGKLELLSEPVASGGEIMQLFEGFVLAHLERRGLPGSIEVSYVMTCKECDFLIPNQLLDALEGQRSFHCPSCASELQLESRRSLDDPSRTRKSIKKLQKSADQERSRVAARTSVQGKVEVHEFDAFLAHNSRDEETVVGLAERLRDHGLNPWLDKDQIPPGRWFQDIIQEAIGKVGSAVVILGESGLGRWQALELRAFLSQCIERHIPVIPTLLPEAEIPEVVRPFTSELQVVRFEKTIDETEAFADLVWGITGERKDRERILRG